MGEQTEFARTKEAAVWGILYGFQQERIDFRLIHVLDGVTREAQILIFRWHKNNPPKIETDHLTCTLMFNMEPVAIRVDFSNVISIMSEGGVGVKFLVELDGQLNDIALPGIEVPPEAPEPPTKERKEVSYLKRVK